MTRRERENYKEKVTPSFCDDRHIEYTTSVSCCEAKVCMCVCVQNTIGRYGEVVENRPQSLPQTDIEVEI